MRLSVFDIFKIGIGPSSSHTVGPMKAARSFAERLRDLDEAGAWERCSKVVVELYGSLAHTGKGHGTDVALQLGLEGETPEDVDVDAVPGQIARIAATGEIALLGSKRVAFRVSDQVIFLRRKSLPLHSNGMRFLAKDASGKTILESTYYSVGGGFVVDASGAPANETREASPFPYPFKTGADILRICRDHGLSLSTLVLENEKSLRPEKDVRDGVLRLVHAMRACVVRGCEREGVLPGGLKVTRRAAALHRKLRADAGADALVAIDWVNLWALAVNEENAAGGRVVTAPTNGAAGIIPAVLHYYQRWIAGADDNGAVRFLLTAAAIGMLYKMNASISGAEVGCQGEVGVACSMAAAALAEAMGGSPEQVENAAEIGMEHNLGLTCDPIGGLVQVPCIERNAMGAVKAINAARLALRGTGTHMVSLDKVIATMRQTGADMMTKYKETARGGLAVNIVEC